ncbi:glycosyltransferase [Eionea flava]
MNNSIKTESMSRVGIVVIGRNEGERLRACVHSLATSDVRVVYVDSGSTDDSVQFVKMLGYDSIELDMSTPFSAARARNEGYRYLLEHYHDICYIQFVDGDCEVSKHWLSTAVSHLQSHSQVVAVCGRRQERYPEATWYNCLCDIEWNTPIGLAMATGGDFMCRAHALRDVGGFSSQVIAGEEPELCYRWRQGGWLIERIDAPMTLHDAAMTSVSQWWKRCERAGHAYAQGFDLHGAGGEKYYRAEVLRAVFWSVLALLIITLSMTISAWVLMFLGIYCAKVIQLSLKNKKRLGFMTSFVYSLSLVLSKFAEAKGVATFYYKKLLRRGFHIIEYK